MFLKSYFLASSIRGYGILTKDMHHLKIHRKCCTLNKQKLQFNINEIKMK